MTRRSQRYNQQQLPPKSDDSSEDAVVIPEIMEGQPPLINAQIIQVFVEKNKPEDLQQFLDSVVSYNERRLSILREHAEKHPDAIDMRSAKRSRRLQYMILLALAVALLVYLPFVNLAVAGIFGVVGILIVSGILVNARERELDLQGFLKLINIVVGKQK